MARAGVARGIALAPGVSKNRRRYTPETVRSAYQRLSARLADPDARPVVMRTHHGAGDDSTRIVGRLTRASLTADGAIAYEADLADTTAGRDIAALAEGERPYLANVSIYGWWLGDVATERDEDGPVEVGEDLEIDAVDFTFTPGVAAASVSVSTESAEGRQIVSESTTAEVTAEAAKEPYGDVTYADPGYQPDGKKRYPLDSKAHVRAAWAYINQEAKAAKYTAAQLKRIKGKIKTAAKRYGIAIQGESWLVEPVSEAMPVAEEMPAGSLYISATNGPVTVTVSSYCLDPADLEVVGRAAMAAATDALKAIDPDMDGDIDLPGAAAEDTDDNNMESSAPTPPTAQEAVMADEATVTEAAQAAESAPTRTLTDADVAALAEALAAAIRPPSTETATESAATETATETVAESTDVKALVEAAVAASREQLVADLLKAGVRIERKGFRPVGENAEPSPADLWERRGELFGQALGVLPAE